MSALIFNLGAQFLLPCRYRKILIIHQNPLEIVLSPPSLLILTFVECVLAKISDSLFTFERERQQRAHCSKNGSDSNQ